MKRKAEHQLERGDFLGDDDDETTQQTTQGGAQNTMATPEQIAQRKIVKLKIPGQSDAPRTEISQSAKFELAGALDQPKPAAAGNNGIGAQTPSFLTNLATSTAPSGGLFDNIINKSGEGEKKPEEKKGGLFSGLFNSGNQPTTAGLFTNNQTGSGGLFGSIFGNSGAGLSSLAKKDYGYVHKETGEKEEEAKKEAAKQEKPAAAKPSLFASLADFKPGPNLFSSNTSGSGLFSASLTGGSGAFGGLFGQGNKGGDDGSDDEGEDGDEPEREPSPEADITKSKGNYQYERNYEKVIGKKVNKFKPGAKEMLLEGEVTLNKRNESGAHFIIYRNKAKLNQYQGELIAGLSKTEFLNARQDAISIVSFSTEAPEEGKEVPADAKPKINRDVVKLMFATSDDCNEFKKEVDRVVGN